MYRDFTGDWGRVKNFSFTRGRGRPDDCRDVAGISQQSGWDAPDNCRDITSPLLIPPAVARGIIERISLPDVTRGAIEAGSEVLHQLLP